MLFAAFGALPSRPTWRAALLTAADLLSTLQHHLGTAWVRTYVGDDAAAPGRLHDVMTAHYRARLERGGTSHAGFEKDMFALPRGQAEDTALRQFFRGQLVNARVTKNTNELDENYPELYPARVLARSALVSGSYVVRFSDETGTIHKRTPVTCRGGSVGMEDASV